MDQYHHEIRLLLPIFTKSQVEQMNFSYTDIWVEWWLMTKIRRSGAPI